jgi:hypothetical protein
MNTTTFAVDPDDSVARSNQAIAASGLSKGEQGLVMAACQDFNTTLFRMMVVASECRFAAPAALLGAFRAAITVTLDDAALVVAAAEKGGSR